MRYPIGSYVRIDDRARLHPESAFTLSGWFQPTAARDGAQGLLTRWDQEAGVGYAMHIDAAGCLALCIGHAGWEAERVSTGVPLVDRTWYFLAAAFDPDEGVVRLLQHPKPSLSTVLLPVSVTRPVGTRRVGDAAVPFLMAAWWESGGSGTVTGNYDGKIEAPRVDGRAIDASTLVTRARGGEMPGSPLGEWDFWPGTPTRRISDISGNGVDGHAVNMPTRGATGARFRGDELAWRHSPDTHTAIHFHRDDLEDCGWPVAIELTVPDDLPSGVYAAKLTSATHAAHIPFFVRPAGRKAVARILFLVPTNSYLAYANFREAAAEQIGNLGLYHFHADGSPVVYSSTLRPILNLAPGSTFDVLGDSGAPHQFNADLHLVDWLTEKGFEFDVATDADLDSEGSDLLRQYDVVLTGSHPEYWTGQMLDALEGYLGDGGRLMYLGGNGLIWTTSYDPQRRHVIEVRRGMGTRNTLPGEGHHSTTGEPGGYWRRRGRASNLLVGVGSVAQGFDHSSPYVRTAASEEPRASWIFEGVPRDQLIGSAGLTMGGAAGFEIDATDRELGTPDHALTIASATDFSPTYEHQNPVHVAGTDVDLHEPMRSDMVFFETPGGGAVFSVGSIAYCGALSANGYDNSVSRITENVLRRFTQV